MIMSAANIGPRVTERHSEIFNSKHSDTTMSKSDTSAYETLSERDDSTEDEEDVSLSGIVDMSSAPKFVKPKDRGVKSHVTKTPYVAKNILDGLKQEETPGKNIIEEPTEPLIPMKKTFRTNPTRLKFKNVTENVPVISKPQNKKFADTDYDTISDYETETESDRSDVESGAFAENQPDPSTFLSPVGLKTPRGTNIHAAPHNVSSNDIINTIKLSKQKFFKLTPGRDLNTTPIKFSSFTPLVNKLVSDVGQKRTKEDSDDAESLSEGNGMLHDKDLWSPLVNRVRTKNKNSGSKKMKIETSTPKARKSESLLASPSKYNAKSDPFVEFGSPLSGYKFVARQSETGLFSPTSNVRKQPNVDPYKLSYETRDTSKVVEDPISIKHSAKKPSTGRQTYAMYTKSWSHLLSLQQIVWPNKDNEYLSVTPESVKEFLKEGSEMILAQEFKGKFTDSNDHHDILQRIFRNVLKNERIRWHPDKMVRILSNFGILHPHSLDNTRNETPSYQQIIDAQKKVGNNDNNSSSKTIISNDRFDANDKNLIEQITSTFQIINHIYESLPATE